MPAPFFASLRSQEDEGNKLTFVSHDDTGEGFALLLRIEWNIHQASKTKKVVR